MILTELPAPFSGYETIHTLFPDRADVPEMCISVNRYKKQEFFTRFRLAALPAARDLFFLAAFPDVAERRTAPIPPTSLTPELHHGTEQVIALLVLFKGFTQGAFAMASANFSYFACRSSLRRSRARSAIFPVCLWQSRQQRPQYVTRGEFFSSIYAGYS